MYDKLTQYLDIKGLKIKADENKVSKEDVINEYKDKEKNKPLTANERLDRIGKILGIAE